MIAELEVHSQEYVTQVHGSKALGAQPYGPTIQYLPRILANTSAGAKVIRPRLGASRSRESASSTYSAQLWRLPSDCAAVCTHYLGNGGPLSVRSLAISPSPPFMTQRMRMENSWAVGGRGSSLYCAHHTLCQRRGEHTHARTEH